MSRVTCVLVTGVGGRSVGHQILSALQRVRDRYRLVAADADAFAFGLYVADARYVLPKATDRRYLESVFEVVGREGVQVVLPGTEAELLVLSAARAELAARGCALIASDPDVVTLCLDKARLSSWLTDHGYDAPLTSRPNEWQALATRSGFPIVGKPSQASGGSRGVALLADEAEVREFIQDNERRGTAVILQEYVGSAESEYTVGVLTDRDGALIDSIVLHRHLLGLSLGASRIINGKTYALSTGYSQGFIETYPPVAELCESLTQALGIRGPANIQLRVQNDAIKVFEVHPRFSGTTSIRAECDFNEPDVLIRNALNGEVFGRLAYRRNVAAIRAFQSVIVPIEDVRSVPRLGLL